MKKILAVATNADPEINGKKTGLWLSELTHFVEVVSEAGYEVDIASPSGGKIALDQGSVSGKSMQDPANKHFMENKHLSDLLNNSLKISDVSVSDYSAVYLAGGHGTVFDFRQSEALQKKLTEFHTSGKILSGVCHGVSGFIDTKDHEGKLIVKGKNVTGFSNLEDTIAGVRKLMPYLVETELKRQGAKYHKNVLPFTERVEVEPNLITGQNPASAKAVGKAVLKMLNG